jgi:hypothetical protein
MGVRASKHALAEAAALLKVDTRTARAYLREVQRRANFPVPYATIVAAMRMADSVSVAAVAAVVSQSTHREEQSTEEQATQKQPRERR